MAMADKLLSIAAGELGTVEAPAGSNRTKYGKWYGLDGEPWCMMFVQWCFAQAGMPLPCRTASCSALLRWYRQNRPRQVVPEPRRGDIVIYTFGHTGIVLLPSAGSICAIEGNTSAGEAGSQNNGGGVYLRPRQRSLVSAYIRPEFEEDSMTGEEIYRELQAYLSKQPVPAWARAELEEAMELGITDGTSHMELIPRYQAAIMAKRAAQK